MTTDDELKDQRKHSIFDKKKKNKMGLQFHAKIKKEDSIVISSEYTRVGSECINESIVWGLSYSCSSGGNSVKLVCRYIK